MQSRYPIALGLLLFGVFGVAAFGDAPSSGTFTGSTDQGRAFGLTVAADGQHVTQLSLNVKITNPAGCSVTITSNPTGNFPITGNSFSYDSGATTCGSRLQVSGTFTSATAASGTLTATESNSGCPTVPKCPGTVTTAWSATLAATRVIALSGSLAFGTVMVDTTATRTLTISNSGTSALTVSGITYPSGFSGAWSGTVAAGGSQNVTVTFAPTAAQSYSGTVTVASDKTSGTDTIAASGTGTPAVPEPPAGTITTVAGSGLGFSGDGGPATAAKMRQLWDVAVDGAGNLYVADVGNYCVWKVTAATGVITIFAGNGTSGFSGDGDAATAAQLYSPTGLSVDGAGNVYIADRYNNRIRRVTAATGIITTFAGNGTSGSGGDDGLATAAQLREPFEVTLDGSGNVYIADRNNHRVRKLTVATGIVTTIAGTGTSGFSGDGAAATAAQLYYPAKVAVDEAGNVYIADASNHRIRKVTATTGIITTVAGTGTSGFSGDGGPATAAQLRVPYGVALDGAGNMYVADSDNYRIRKVIALLPGGSDFDGDGDADVLWRHATAGEVWLWPMGGAARVSETYVRTIADTDWEIRGLGDQTGDGKADILWRNKITGMIYFWPMDGSTPLSETYVATVDPAYDIVGTGDYNGDGKSGILWRHLTTGEVWIWLMDGATALSEVHVATVDIGYVVKGSGDLDGDHKADIVWHHAATGEVWVWLMNGTTRLSQTQVGTVPDVGYQIVGVADHTGDGKADILWHHATLGEVWIWTMDGTTRLSETWVATVPDTGYEIVGTGDYNGDGKADILWHHATRGEVWVWLMDGTTKVSETWVGTVPDVGYQIVKVQ